MAPIPEQLNIEAIGFAAKMWKAENGSKNVYMSMNKDNGFSRANNLVFQAATPDNPLNVGYDVSEPQHGTNTRWSLDVEVPRNSALYTFLEKLDNKAREEVRRRASEMFPRMKTDVMSDDQLTMCYLPVFKAATDGSGNGKLKLKIIMPPTAEETARLTKSELERRSKDATDVMEVTDHNQAEGRFEYESSDYTILKAGAKVMPILTTSGIWLNDSQCGISFACSSICVWPHSADMKGVSAFNLNGMVATRKRPHDDISEDGEMPSFLRPHFEAPPEPPDGD